MNPIKPTIKTEILPIVFILAAIISSFFFYGIFPDQVPTHWNMQGEVDDYSSKAIAAFAIPLATLFMYIVFLFIPFLDPKKERYEQFRKIYHVFKSTMVAFLVIIYFFVSMNALGYDYPIAVWVPVMVGALFMVIGNYLSKIKPNWFMGIRTPWTLSSEENWNKTHRFASKVFVLGGLLMMAMPWYSDTLRPIIFSIVIVMMVLGSSGYSLLIYLMNKNNDNKQRKQEDQASAESEKKQ